MLNIQADAYYTVENRADHHIVSVQGPYSSYEAALASLSDLYRRNPGAEQLVYPMVGKSLIEERTSSALRSIQCFDRRHAWRYCATHVEPADSAGSA